MAENSLLGARVFTYLFHLLANQFSKTMFIHIFKILKYVMTLAATVARRRNIPEHLAL
jgi:hypothetical protein